MEKLAVSNPPQFLAGCGQRRFLLGKAEAHHTVIAPVPIKH